jgi:hypothetical protein
MTRMPWLIVALVAIGAAPLSAAEEGPQIAAATGVAEVRGFPAIVEVLLRVAPGVDPEPRLERALTQRGARLVRESPTSGTTFNTLFGATWPQFADPPRQGAVVQHYNTEGDPTGGGGLEALLAAQHTWSTVHSSAFGFAFGGTTRRCPSLFFECGSGGAPDGFNDVGWLPIDSEEILGAAFFLLDPSGGEFREVDVVLNTGTGPWFTDGRSTDVQTVMLHELGHVAGLDHDLFDPAAVMFPSIVMTRRALAESDVDGIAYLYPKAAHLPPGHPVQPPSPITATVVAVIDDATPAGERLTYFTGSDLDDAGGATFVVARESLLDGSGHEETVYRAGPGGAAEVAGSGRPAPGGGTFGAGANGRPTLSSGGELAFTFDLDPTSFPIGLNSGLFRSAAGSLTAAVRPGTTPAPSGDVFQGAADGQAGDGGDVVFTGIVETPEGSFGSLGRGIYRVRQDGAVETVAAPGDLVAGGQTLDFASFPSVNRRGDVAFDGHLAGERCALRTSPALDISCTWGVFIRRAGAAVAEPIAVPGQRAPNGQDFRAASGAVVNGRGDVLFAADAEAFGSRPLRTIRGAGLYVSSGGAIRAVYQPDDPLPGGGHGHVGFQRPSTGGWDMNDGGNVAFVASPGFNAFAGDLFFDNYVYVERGGKLRRVAGSGTVVRGVGTIKLIGTAVDTGDQETSFATGAHVSIGERDVLFPATLADGRVVLLRTRF